MFSAIWRRAYQANSVAWTCPSLCRRPNSPWPGWAQVLVWMALDVCVVRGLRLHHWTITGINRFSLFEVSQWRAHGVSTICFWLSNGLPQCSGQSVRSFSWMVITVVSLCELHRLQARTCTCFPMKSMVLTMFSMSLQSTLRHGGFPTDLWYTCLALAFAADHGYCMKKNLVEPVWERVCRAVTFIGIMDLPESQFGDVIVDVDAVSFILSSLIVQLNGVVAALGRPPFVDAWEFLNYIHHHSSIGNWSVHWWTRSNVAMLWHVTYIFRVCKSLSTIVPIASDCQLYSGYFTLNSYIYIDLHINTYSYVTLYTS